VSGETWPEFNATDFSRTRLLKAGEMTSVKDLALSIGAEVRKLGAVAVHAYADSFACVFIAVKAAASVPTENRGLEVECVPSFGWSSDGAGGRSRSFRLYVRRPAGGDGSSNSGSKRTRSRRHSSVGVNGGGGQTDSSAESNCGGSGDRDGVK